MIAEDPVAGANESGGFPFDEPPVRLVIAGEDRRDDGTFVDGGGGSIECPQFDTDA